MMSGVVGGGLVGGGMNSNALWEKGIACTGSHEAGSGTVGLARPRGVCGEEAYLGTCSDAPCGRSCHTNGTE